jgi:hypothetical protein
MTTLGINGNGNFFITGWEVALTVLDSTIK